MTPAQLTAAGECLYGEAWQSPLSRDLGVADRTVRRWVSGDSAIPDGVRADVVKLLERRQRQLAATLAKLAG